ncbi:zinc-binding dehydrogenase [Actinokineospora spheciospongiae]|nr:zinc-binding dehydrogenase [Actinokineospora spheciospongiae]
MGLTADSTGTLLVVGGAGGVGSMVVQLARGLTGVTVVATASRPESREWALTLGAHRVVDHRRLRAEVSDVNRVFSPFSEGNVETYAETARLVDAGVLRTTMTRKLTPTTPENLRAAHEAVEGSAMIGKIVVATE